MSNTNKKLTAQNAILKLGKAIEARDKKTVLDLISPDNKDNMPDWDDVPDVVYEQWEQMLCKADSFLGI